MSNSLTPQQCSILIKEFDPLRLPVFHCQPTIAGRTAARQADTARIADQNTVYALQIHAMRMPEKGKSAVFFPCVLRYQLAFAHVDLFPMPMREKNTHAAGRDHRMFWHIAVKKIIIAPHPAHGQLRKHMLKFTRIIRVVAQMQHHIRCLPLNRTGHAHIIAM